MTCSACHRAVNATDVDNAGRCCFCQTMPTPSTGDRKPPPTEASVDARAKRLGSRADNRSSEHEDDGA